MACTEGSRMRLVAVGDNCLDLYPDLGLMTVGGQAVNVAVGWARLGARSDYLGPIAQDAAGDAVARALAEAGVGVAHARRVPGPTGVTEIRIAPDGERVFGSSDPGVGRDFQPEPWETAALDPLTAWVHLANLASVERAVTDIRRSLPSAGISWDISDDWRSGLGDLDLRGLDLVLFSWPGRPDEGAVALADRLLADGARLAVGTCGRFGSLARQPDRTVHQGPLEGPIVDSCGAGDAFTSRFVHERLRGSTIEAALLAATEAGTAACAYVGSFPQSRMELVRR